VTRIPIPKPSFLDECELLGAFDGERRWRSTNGKRLYTWDSLHGEIEVFNKQGYHLGAVDAVNGVLTKPGIKGRRINV
jgi:Cytotoxic